MSKALDNENAAERWIPAGDWIIAENLKEISDQFKAVEEFFTREEIESSYYGGDYNTIELHCRKCMVKLASVCNSRCNKLYKNLNNSLLWLIESRDSLPNSPCSELLGKCTEPTENNIRKAENVDMSTDHQSPEGVSKLIEQSALAPLTCYPRTMASASKR